MSRRIAIWSDHTLGVGGGEYYTWALATFYPQALADRIDEYDAILTISEYSAEGVCRRWGRDNVALAPPPVPRGRFVAGPKEPVILSVGRFFEADAGNAKKHALMVHAFGRLLEGGLEGWRLVLAGASDPTQVSYVERIRALAVGAPIEVRTDLSHTALAALYAQASIYWHAAGLTPEGLTEQPSAAEHFGISVVEAMAAGGGPVVPDIGGPAEIVQHGRNGLTCRSVDELVAHTRALADDGGERQVLAGGAEARARDFDRETFDTRVRELVDALFAEPATQGDYWLRQGRVRTAEARRPVYLQLARCAPEARLSA